MKNSRSQRANANRNRTPRHRARELVLQGLYQWLLNHEEAAAIYAYLRESRDFEKADVEYCSKLLYGAIAQAEQLQLSLLPFIDRPLAELSPVEHAVLLIGAFELENQIDIPYKVIINEAVELAKSFGSIDGHKYINGVLDHFAESARLSELKKG